MPNNKYYISKFSSVSCMIWGMIHVSSGMSYSEMQNPIPFLEQIDSIGLDSFLRLPCSAWLEIIQHCFTAYSVMKVCCLNSHYITKTKNSQIAHI